MKKLLQKLKKRYRDALKLAQRVWQKLSSRYFWRRNKKVLIISASFFTIFVLMVALLVNGQKDVGAKEAGTELNALAQNIRKQYRTRPDFWGLSTQGVIGQRLYPTTMTAEGGQLNGYFKTPVTIGADETGAAVMPTGRQFAIAYHGLTQAQCVGLGTYKFPEDFWFGVKKVSLKAAQASYDFVWGDKDFNLPPLKSALKHYCRAKDNRIVFYFE